MNHLTVPRRLWIGLALLALLLGSWLLGIAQLPPTPASETRYRLVSEEFFPGQRVEKLQVFEAQVNQHLQAGWSCLGPPDIQIGNSARLQPAIITQALVREINQD